MNIKKTLTCIALTSLICVAQEKELQVNSDFKSYSAIQIGSRIVSWVGTGIMLYTVATDDPSSNKENERNIGLMKTSTYMQTLGILANGISSTLMVSNAKSVGKNVELRGWIPYSISMGSGLVGATILGSGELNDTRLLIALPFLVNSAIFQYISWAKFSGNADRSKDAMLLSNLKYNFAPIASGNEILPGVMVSGSF